MSPEELMQLYALTQYAPGNTAAQRLNFLQDLGFDLFGRPQQFVAEEFVADPEPYLRNPVADIYGSNEGYLQVFAAINNGVDPTTAVKQAVDAGTLELPLYGSDAPNPYEVASQYAQKEIENEMELANWEQKTGAERAQFMEKQNRLRQEFEQKRPLSFQDLMGQSQYEAMGAPTVDELMNLSEQQRSEWAANRAPARGSVDDMARMYGERVVRPKGAAAPAAPARQPSLPKQDIFRNKQYADALRSQLEKRLGAAQQTFVPTERSQAALQNVALMKLLGS